MQSWKGSFAALLIAQTLAIIGFSISQPVIPLFLEQDIGITDPVRLKTWVGVLSSSAMLSMAIFAPIWGNLADIFSRRAMLLRALLGGSVIMSLMGFVTTPWQFLVLRILQGAITGTVAAATVLTAGLAPVAQVAFALGLLQTGIATGNSLGPMIGGLISDFLSYRAAFFSTGICLGLAGLIVLKWVREDPKPVNEGNKKKFTLIPNFRPVFSSPQLVTIMLVSLGLYTSTSIAIPMLPLFIRDLVLGVSGEASLIASTTGLVLGIGAGFTAMAAVLMGRISTRIGYWRALILCLSAAAALIFPQAFVSNVVQLTILRAASSFFIGGAIPVLNAIVAVTADKEHQGTVYGVKTSIVAAGSALGPLIGSAASMLGLRLIFIASALVLSLAVLGAVWRRSRLEVRV